jgi:hypothetical protein
MADVRRSYSFVIADIREFEIDKDRGDGNLWFRGYNEQGMEVEVIISQLNIVDLLLESSLK